MKALSIQQPWIWAILHAGKRAENRTWRPPTEILNTTIALHASQLTDMSGVRKFERILIEMKQMELLNYYRVSPKAHGAIVGTATITGWAQTVKVQVLPEKTEIESIQYFTMSNDTNYGEQLLSTPWSFGPIVWGLSNVNVLSVPIPCPGHLKLWPLSSEIADRLMKAVSR